MYTFIHKFRDYLRYREAVKKADEAHAKDGERYYVLPTENRKKLAVLNRTEFRRMKTKGYTHKDATIRDLVNGSYYFTPYRNGEGTLSKKNRKLKLKYYYTCCKNLRKMEKQKKGSRK